MASKPPELTLLQLLADYGDRWQIQFDERVSCWTAVRRPTPTAMHLLVGRDLGDLSVKLSKAATQ
jgi:hypothetical protein